MCSRALLEIFSNQNVWWWWGEASAFKQISQVILKPQSLRAASGLPSSSLSAQFLPSVSFLWVEADSVMNGCSDMLTEACCIEGMNCVAVPFLMWSSWVHSGNNKPVFLRVVELH